ncbi:hypothetical protein [Streptomyces sp. NPDC050848]|uniref:recombination directionality factor n=1 Tax=Streptomyces sp. NPDC050848 TaxID=3155791 RepID=UPI0033F101B9
MSGCPLPPSHSPWHRAGPAAGTDLAGVLSPTCAGGALPAATGTWHIGARDGEMTARLAALFGKPSDRPTAGCSLALCVDSRLTVLPIVIEERESISVQMVRRGGRAAAHACDGESWVLPAARAGEPCGCPRTMAERRVAARSGFGPKPDITMIFRLADAPGVGRFAFRTSSWDLAGELERVLPAFGPTGLPDRFRLLLATGEFVGRGGTRVRYARPGVECEQTALTGGPEGGLSGNWPSSASARGEGLVSCAGRSPVPSRPDSRSGWRRIPCRTQRRRTSTCAPW